MQRLCFYTCLLFCSWEGVSASVDARIHPPGQTSHRLQTSPCAVHSGRYGQQAGGTHPPGMHSCFNKAHAGTPADLLVSSTDLLHTGINRAARDDGLSGHRRVLYRLSYAAGGMINTFFDFSVLLLPSANEVWGRNCFHKRVSRILSTEGGVPGQTPLPQVDKALGR